jgi:septal ring factor EnvC (AmiA/AmiB activator)
MLQNERQENDATKKLLKESQQECEELEKKIRDANKKIDRLQDNAERFENIVIYLYI